MSALATVSATNSLSSATASQTGSSDLDKEAFMTLLVTQFQYQDPLNPMEDKEFIAQLAQFSSLEQMMNLNESMVGLTTATKNQEMINATSYIGKNVDMSGNTVSKSTDSATGDYSISKLRYALGETATSAQVNIYDSNRQLVRSYTLPAQAPGTHEFDGWDGKTETGTIAPDGVYTVIPVFFNAEGQSLQYDSVVDGRVAGVLSDNGVTYLTLDDNRTTALSEVRRVTEPEVVGNTNTSTDTDTGDGTDTEPNTGTETEPNTGTETEPETGTGTETEPETGTGTETTP